MNKKMREASYCSEVCKAWCCKYLVVDYDVDENNKPMDDRRLFTLRGIEVDEKNHKLIIPCRCSWLTKTNKCRLYAWRPKSCMAFRCEKLNSLKDNIEV